MGDIISQGGGRARRRWPRRAALAAAALLAASLTGYHLLGQRHAGPHPARELVTLPSASSPARAAIPAPGLARQPDGIPGPVLRWAAPSRLPAAGDRPAWFWPATGQLQPIAALPPDAHGYQLDRVMGGWTVQGAPGCGGCVAAQRPVYFLADGARSVTRLGLADASAPGAAAGTIWLTSYPPGSRPGTAAATAREVSTAGAPLGPRRMLPAGYVIDRGTDAGLLLAPAAQLPGAAYMLWNPAGPRIRRTFKGVIAASSREIAWSAEGASQCRVHVMSLTTGRGVAAELPGASSVANAAFSPDGRYLALQVSFYNNGDDGALAMQLDVLTAATGALAVVPGTWVSSDALVGFGWPGGRDSLVAEFGFTSKVQLASWQPGAGRLAVAAFWPRQGLPSLALGQYAP